MSQDEALIKGTLDTILEYAYPETYKRYLSYFVRIRPKELATKHAHYKRRERMMEIFNLSREPRFLLLTCIHELTHHVEYEDLGDSGHEEPFYERFRKLYLTAVGLKLLELTDLADERDAGDYKAILRYDLSFSVEDVPVFEAIEKRMVIVKEGRKIKEQLKANEFHWFTVSHTWQRECRSLQEAEQIVHELLQKNPHASKDHFLIRPVMSPTFLSYYYIGIENGYEYRYGLKELGYLWEGYGVRKMWVKKVDAQAYFAELEKLTVFAGIEFKKVTPNINEEKILKEKEKQQKKEASDYEIDFYI